jgi:hypothetical protein
MSSPCSLYAYAPPPSGVRQRLGKHIPAESNAHATIEELLDAVLSTRSVSYEILNL